MKKALKITGITIASLVGLALIAIVIALATVTSPKRLTNMVKKYVPQYVNFDMGLERAKLTLIKTFPDIGLELDKVSILCPLDGAPSDTFAQVDKLILSANARKFMKNKQIVVNKLIIDDAKVNIFTDAQGNSNLDIFSSNSENTTSKPFDYSIDLQEVKLNNANVDYTDLSKELNAGMKALDIDVKGSMKDQDVKANLKLKTQALALKTKALSSDINNMQLDFDGDVNDFNDIDGVLKLSCPQLSLYSDYPVLDNDHLELTLPVTMSLKPINANLKDALVGLNDYLITLNGQAAMDSHGDTDIDIAFNTNTLDIEDVLSYLPEKVVKRMNGIQFKGKIELNDGKVKGVYNDSLMPLITANVKANDATVAIPQLPYPLTKVDLNTLLHLDLNDSINARDITLSAMMNRSKFNVTGQATDLADNLALDLNLKSDLLFTDLKSFLPKTTKLNGRGKLTMTLKSTLDDLLKTVRNYQFNNRLKADASLSVSQLSFDMDTIHALSPKMDIDLTLPASRKIKGRSGAYIGLKSGTLDANVGTGIQAKINDLQLAATADHLNGGVEDILSALEMNMGRLDLVYDTIRMEANQPSITLETTPKKNKNLNLKASLNSGDINAAAGTSYTMNSQSLKVVASASENKAKEDFLNRWNPTADFTLNQAELKIAGLDEKVMVPTIDFVFNPHELGFKKGTVKVGNSDLSLKGNVVGISQWIEDHKNLMKGEIEVSSQHLDINEIMDLTSGMGVNEDEKAMNEGGAEDHPFMVPEGIDFSFDIKSKKALYGNFDLNNLGGTVTIKDGTLLLREIAFTNEAAEMQLTAIYQSPRKNHLFLGMDFHLLNVQIYDLLHMIPEIDTIVPMLKTFDGAAEFHIAAQTNLKSNYELKMSTLRASADIEGANLRVKDIASFTKITDMLKVSNNGEYKIDSIDIQMTAFRDEVDLWPFQIAMGKYKATVDGHYNLNTIGEYHISVTDSPLPTRLGLKISGPLKDLSYTLESCKYPHLYRPERRNETEKMVMELKKLIADKLKETVR